MNIAIGPVILQYQLTAGELLNEITLDIKGVFFLFKRLKEKKEPGTPGCVIYLFQFQQKIMYLRR